MTELETTALIQDYFSVLDEEGTLDHSDHHWGEHTDHSEWYNEYCDYADRG